MISDLFQMLPYTFLGIQVTFLHHKGVYIELVLLIHVKIRKFSQFRLDNDEHATVCNSGITDIRKRVQDFLMILRTLGLNPLYFGETIYFLKQESESGQGTSLHMMHFQSYQCFELVVTKLISRTKSSSGENLHVFRAVFRAGSPTTVSASADDWKLC